MQVQGIHHISSIVGHAQKNIDFYASVLGLRLVKNTLNYDDQYSYHFYYGNRDGSSGLTTTFPMTDSIEGHSGSGQVDTLVYAVPSGSFNFWHNRLVEFGLKPYYYDRFGIKRLAFSDPDGLEIEMIEVNRVDENAWEYNGITKEVAIIEITGSILFSNNPPQSLKLLVDGLGYQLINEDEEFYLLKINEQFLYLNKQIMARGRMGIGSVHHIAFKVDNEEIALWHQKLIDLGMKPTEIKNRKYFKSIYFREPGGILIELATEGPGVLIDEAVETLGSDLLMPPHFKEYEDEVREKLMPVTVREVSKLEGYGYRDRYEHDLLVKKQRVKEELTYLLRKSKTGSLSEEEKETLKTLRQDFITLR